MRRAKAQRLSGDENFSRLRRIGARGRVVMPLWRPQMYLSDNSKNDTILLDREWPLAEIWIVSASSQNGCRRKGLECRRLGDIVTEMNRSIETSDGKDILGVAVHALTPIADFRGSLSEIHRDEWLLGPRPVQWDFVVSQANVLRGVHVHRLRWDYIIPLDGRGMIGLADLRREQKSFGRRLLIDLTGEAPTVVTIPPGVAHGIYAQSRFRYLYGLTVAWDGTDEDLGCRYDDPALGLKWPAANPMVLQRDLDLPDFATLSQQYDLAVRGEAIIADQLA